MIICPNNIKEAIEANERAKIEIMYVILCKLKPVHAFPYISDSPVHKFAKVEDTIKVVGMFGDVLLIFTQNVELE